MPTGEKKGTSPPPRMCKRGNRAVPHLKHLGDGTSTLDLSQEKSQTRDPAPHLPVSPDETEPPGKHRRKAPRTTLGSFPAGSCSGRRPSEQDGQCGRRAPGARRTRRVGGRAPGLHPLRLTHQLMVPKVALQPGSSRARGPRGSLPDSTSFQEVT